MTQQTSDVLVTDPAARTGYLEHAALTAVQDLLEVADPSLIDLAIVQEIIDLGLELRARVRDARAEAA